MTGEERMKRELRALGHVLERGIPALPSGSVLGEGANGWTGEIRAAWRDVEAAARRALEAGDVCPRCARPGVCPC